ncbi:hypothetical protein BDZ94DRAFT_1131774, partial [Collybia nuda]
FPPEPLTDNVSERIIRSFCEQLTSEKLEEAGCAVCGQLKPKKDLSPLKNVKAHL